MSDSHDSEEHGITAQNIMARVMITAAIILVLLVLTWGFNGYIEHQRNPNRELRSTLTGEFIEVVLLRNRYGHYHATGQINGLEVEFLVDTGATYVAIPDSVARKLGLERGSPVPVQTANGTAQAFPTRLASVSIGPIVLHQVRALISPGLEGAEVLLGMSVLKTLELVQRGEELTLRQIRPSTL